MHVDHAVALASEAETETEIGALGRADEPGEGLDLLDRQAGDGGSPLRIAAFQMLREFVRMIGVALEIIPIRKAVAEENVHHCAGERPVGARLHQERHVGLLHGGVLVDVDGDDLGAALLARLHRMGHHVDLRMDRVRAPDHDAVGDRHLARIGAAQMARAGHVAGPAHRRADGGILAGILLHVAQAVDAVAHHVAHGAGIIIGPDGLGAEVPLRLQELFGHDVERLVPGNPLELARTLRAGALHGVEQPVRVVDALRIARHLRADHSGRVAVALRPMHAADRAPVDHLHLEGADGGAIVRAD